MSWTGFKKAVNRAGQQVLGKRAEKVEDLDFDAREEEFVRFETLVVELSKDLDRFKDGMGAIVDSQVELMATLDSYYGEGPRDGPSQAYLEKLIAFQREGVPQLREPLQRTVVGPIEEMLAYNDEVHKLIKKRGRKKFDYEVARGKLDKHQQEYETLELSYGQKASDVTGAQLQRASERAEKTRAEFRIVESIYQDINTKLKAEMDQYLNLRFGLLDPTFEAFVKLQVKLFGDMEAVEAEDPPTDAMSQEQALCGDLDHRLDEILANMKGLDIHNM